ncbi:MAG: hypothetical protein OQJ84_02335 [Xanthomonadales bacterium]|nr:hypothetical protein [Xanthomonadales bacterium]
MRSAATISGMKIDRFLALLPSLLSPAQAPGVVSHEGDALLVSGGHANAVYQVSYSQ